MTGAWVNTAGDDSYFGRGWVADMGLYKGPWPLRPPAVLEKTDDEVDFVVGLPNPAHPGDPHFALDETYATPLWGSERDPNSFGPPATNYSFYWDTLGGTTTLPANPPAGAHLWVEVFTSDSSVPPAFPPSHYVPASYATGGNAAFETAAGAWSPWKPGPIVRHAAHLLVQWKPASVGAARHLDRSSGPGEPPPPTFQLLEWDAEIVAELQADIATQSVGLATSAAEILWAMDTRKWTFPILGSVFDHWDFGLDTAQRTERWTAKTTLDPLNLSGLTFGVDYGESPYADLDYESVMSESDVSVPSWVDVANYIGPASGGLEFWYENPETVKPRISSGIDIRVAPGNHLVVDDNPDASPIWVDTSAFTLFTVELSYTVNWMAEGIDEQIIDVDLAPSPLPLASLIPRGTTVITAFRSASFVRTGGRSPAQEITPDPDPGEDSGGAHYITAGLNFAGMFTDHSEFVQYTGLPYDAINPPWRYWVPGAIIPTERLKGTGVPAPRIPVFRGR